MLLPLDFYQGSCSSMVLIKCVDNIIILREHSYKNRNLGYFLSAAVARKSRLTPGHNTMGGTKREICLNKSGEFSGPKPRY